MNKMSNAAWRTTDETHRPQVGHQAISGPTAKHSTVLEIPLRSSLGKAKQAEEALKANPSNRRRRVKEGSIEDSAAIRTSRLQTRGRRPVHKAMVTSLITMIDRRLSISSSIQRPAASTHLDQKEEASRVVNKVQLKANSKGAKEATEAANKEAVNKEEVVNKVANGVAIKINKVQPSQAVRSVIKEGLKEASNSLTG